MASTTRSSLDAVPVLRYSDGAYHSGQAIVASRATSIPLAKSGIAMFEVPRAQTAPSMSSPQPAFMDSDAAELFETFVQADADPPSYRRDRSALPLPFCLPQGCLGSESSDTPFVRGWNDCIASAGISMEEWLGFVDGLNVAMSATQPLRIVSSAAVAISTIPLDITMIVGTAVHLIAETGKHVMSKSLTHKYIRYGNKHLFAARGLRVRIANTHAMRQIIGITSNSVQESMGTRAERIAMKIGLRVLGARGVINHCASPVLASDAMVAARVLNATTSAPLPLAPRVEFDFLLARRFALLGEPGSYALPVFTAELPPPPSPEGMGRASALVRKIDVWRTKQKAKRRTNRAERHARQDLKLSGPELQKQRAERAAKEQDRAEIKARLHKLNDDSALWLILVPDELDDAISSTYSSHFLEGFDVGDRFNSGNAVRGKHQQSRASD